MLILLLKLLRIQLSTCGKNNLLSSPFWLLFSKYTIMCLCIHYSLTIEIFGKSNLKLLNLSRVFLFFL